MSSGRLLSDDLAFNQINYGTTTYHPSLYPLPDSTSVYPKTNYPKKSLATIQRKNVPPNDSFASLNDITEYSDSLVTASNTNTASSVAHSINDHNINGPMNMFSNHQQNYNRTLSNNDDTSLFQTSWSSPQIKQKGQSDEIKTKSSFKQQPLPTTTTRSQPSTNVQKKSSADELNDDITPVQSPQLPMTLTKNQRNATFTESNKQSSSIDIQAWVNDTKKESPIDEKIAQEAWSVKIGQLNQVQAQREKEKSKSSRGLPITSKKVDNKPVSNKTKSITDTKSRDTMYQSPPHETYFDSLFDGDFFRKPVPHDYPLNSSFHQPISKKNKLITNSLSKLFIII
jgi:hypothetical protein